MRAKIFTICAFSGKEVITTISYTYFLFHRNHGLDCRRCATAPGLAFHRRISNRVSAFPVGLSSSWSNPSPSISFSVHLARRAISFLPHRVNVPSPEVNPRHSRARWFSACGPRKYLVNVYNWHAGSYYSLCSSRSVAENKAVLEAPQICICMRRSLCVRFDSPFLT